MANRNIARIEKIEANRSARRGGGSYLIEQQDGESEAAALARATHSAFYVVIAPAEPATTAEWVRNYGGR